MCNAIMNLVWYLLNMKGLKDIHLEILCGKGVSGVYIKLGRQMISLFIT